jgi:hypothetical protein
VDHLHDEQKEGGAGERVNRRPSLLSAIAALAASALLATSAVAATSVEVPSAITIHRHELTVKGKVTDPAYPRCRAGRRIRVLIADSKVRQVLARGRTGPRGHYKIRVQGSAGISFAAFYTEVGASTLTAGATSYQCRAAVSAVAPGNPT